MDLSPIDLGLRSLSERERDWFNSPFRDLDFHPFPELDSYGNVVSSSREEDSYGQRVINF